MINKASYIKRILSAYVFNRSGSNTSFWHAGFSRQSKSIGSLEHYYLDYRNKVAYSGPYDSNGVPMLNYGGDIGQQYNPDAIAQYALGCFELYLESGTKNFLNKFMNQAEWFMSNISMLDADVGVWYYRFDFEYYEKLKNPWYTSLGQGHGISVLVRAWQITNDSKYLNVAHKAFASYERSIDHPGGISFVDPDNNLWFEEYIISKPTHILNGFIWSLWGLYDYWLATKNKNALQLFNKGVKTLQANLYKYDNGIWSKYDLAQTTLPSIAGGYYHKLHIEQLNVMHKLTGEDVFNEVSELWESYRGKMFNKSVALMWKVFFKLFYY